MAQADYHYIENYSNIVHIEALTAIDIARKHIVPSIVSYQAFLLNETVLKEKCAKKLSRKLEEDLLGKISELAEKFYESLEKLDESEKKYNKTWTNLKKAKFCKDILLKEMQNLRGYADKMELLLGKEYIKFPTYEDILYSVKY